MVKYTRYLELAQQAKVAGDEVAVQHNLQHAEHWYRTVVAERGIGEPGPIREHYLADDRIEVCWPVSVGRPT